MTRVTFDEVYLYADKSGTCEKCGKPARRAKKFWQTLNPFNKNSEGLVKSRQEIYTELNHEISAWRKEPVLHAKCKQPHPTIGR
jgi:hypothetical protein